MRVSHRRLPILLLACALFVVTTSEFQVAAMLTDMSAELGVPVADLGLLVTVYSVGMGVGGPAVVWALRGLRSKVALTLVMSSYAAAEGLAAAVTQPALLGVLRLITGALSGATFGMALSAGMALSDEADRTRASAVVLTGLMAGTLLGLPLSHVLATAAGWRSSFALLAAAAALMAVAVALILPPIPTPSSDGTSGAAELRSGALWARYLSSFLVIGGSFAAFAFIDPILRRVALTSYVATAAMLGFGIAAFVINTLTGRVAQNGSRRWLLVGLVVQLAALALLLATPQIPLLVVLATVLLGATGIALNPLLVTRVVAVAQPGVLVNTVHTSAITLGVAAATAIGSSIYNASGDLSSTLITGVVLTVAAIALVAVTTDGVLSPRPVEAGATR